MKSKITLFGFLACIFLFSAKIQAQYVNTSILKPTLVNPGQYKYLIFGTSGSDKWGGFMWNQANAAYGDGDDMCIYTYGDRDLSLRTGTGNLIVFPTAGGNMGIGTKDPQHKLEVQGDIYSQTDIAWGQGRAVLSYEYPYSKIMWGDNSGWYLSFNRKSDNEKLFSMRSSDGQAYFKGNVGIGTTSMGTHKLAVEGSIGAREIKVEASGWSDFVFEENYELPSLVEVEKHIDEKGHLKDIPSAKEVEENGIDLGDMNAKLLQKIEELTLYVIQQNKRIKKLEGQNK